MDMHYNSTRKVGKRTYTSKGVGESSWRNEGRDKLVTIHKDKRDLISFPTLRFPDKRASEA